MLSNAARIAYCISMIAVLVRCDLHSALPTAQTRIADDPSSRLKPAPGYATVQRECTICHSEKLITQNRASREGWTETIRWMQKTQNLRAFSAQEEKIILDYLAEHYAPHAIGRRPPLAIRNWYVLEPRVPSHPNGRDSTD